MRVEKWSEKRTRLIGWAAGSGVNVGGSLTLGNLPPLAEPSSSEPSITSEFPSDPAIQSWFLVVAVVAPVVVAPVVVAPVVVVRIL